MKFIEDCKQCFAKILDSDVDSLSIDMDSLLDNWLNTIGSDGIALEWITEDLYIAGKNSISSFQEGYKGNDWSKNWIVIAKWIGDPIIYNIETKEVLTAMHGVGIWEPYAIAPSLKDFGLVLAIWCKLYCEKYNKLVLDDDFEILDSFLNDLQKELAKVLETKYVNGFLKLIDS